MGHAAHMNLHIMSSPGGAVWPLEETKLNLVVTGFCVGKGFWSLLVRLLEFRPQHPLRGTSFNQHLANSLSLSLHWRKRDSFAAFTAAKRVEPSNRNRLRDFESQITTFVARGWPNRWSQVTVYPSNPTQSLFTIERPQYQKQIFLLTFSRFLNAKTPSTQTSCGILSWNFYFGQWISQQREMTICFIHLSCI